MSLRGNVLHPLDAGQHALLSVGGHLLGMELYELGMEKDGRIYTKKT